MENDCFLTLDVCRKRMQALIDSGAVASCCNLDLVRKLKLKISPPDTNFSLVSANKSPIETIGTTEVELHIQGLVVPFKLHIVKDLSFQILLGNDFLRYSQAQISYKTKTISLFDDLISAPLTTLADKFNIARIAETIIIPPRTEAIVQINVPQAYQGKQCFLENTQPNKSTDLMVGRAIIQPTKKRTLCRVCNVSNREAILKTGRPIARVTLIHEQQLVCSALANEDISTDKADVDNNDLHDVNLETVPPHEERLTYLTKMGLTLNNSNLTTEEMQQLTDLLYRYREIFCSSYEDLPESLLEPVHINIEPGTKPIRLKQYPLPPLQGQVLELFADQLLKAGIVKESDSPWNAPTVMLRKRGFDANKPLELTGWRMCSDFRRLNEKIVNVYQPLTDVETIFTSIADAKSKLFSSFDMVLGFYQQRIDEESQAITGWSTPSRHLVYLRQPMGLRTSSANFLHSMYTIFREQLKGNMAIYIDDAILHDAEFPVHLKRLETVFGIIRKYRLRISPTKLQIAKQSLKFLGFCFDEFGQKIDPDRYAKIRDMPSPTNVKQTKSILGFFNFFKKFCPKYSIITQPIRKLLQAGIEFHWGEEQQKALESLKDIMLTNACLHYPRMDEPMYIISDSSSRGLSHGLYQRVGPGLKPISFGGRAMTQGEQSSCSTDLELFGVLHALQSYRRFLNPNTEFHILTDNISLQYIQNLRYSSSPKLVRYALLLQTMRFKITHLPGASNPADLWSRHFITETDENPLDTHPESLNDILHFNYLAGIDCSDSDGTPQVSKRPDAEPRKTRRFRKYCIAPMITRSAACKLKNKTTEETARETTKETARETESRSNKPGEHISQVIEPEVPEVDAVTAELFSAPDTIITLEQQADSPFMKALIAFLKDGTVSSDKNLATRVEDRYKDYFIRREQLWHYARRSKKMRLFKRVLPRTEQLCIPQCMRLNILRSIHDQSHWAFQKCYLTARTKYHWEGCATDFREFTETCSTCKMIRNNKKKQQVIKPLPVASTIFSTLHIDFHTVVTSKKKTSTDVIEQPKHVLVVVCQLSGYVELFACKTQGAAETAACMVQYFLRHGVPSCIISDLGTSWVNSVFAELMKFEDMKIAHITTSAYHPNSNSLVELQNRSLIRHLRAHCEDKSKFADFLPTIASAVNATVQTTTGFSPYFTVFGKSYTAAIDTRMNASEATSIRSTCPKGLEQVAEKLKVFREIVQQSTIDTKQRDSERRNKKATKTTFREGERVYLAARFVDRKWNNAKHHYRYVGPYCILRMPTEYLAKLQEYNTGRILKRNVNTCHLISAEDDRREALLQKLSTQYHFEPTMDDEDETHTTVIHPLAIIRKARPEEAERTKPIDSTLHETDNHSTKAVVSQNARPTIYCQVPAIEMSLSQQPINLQNEDDKNDNRTLIINTHSNGKFPIPAPRTKIRKNVAFQVPTDNEKIADNIPPDINTQNKSAADSVNEKNKSQDESKPASTSTAKSAQLSKHPQAKRSRLQVTPNHDYTVERITSSRKTTDGLLYRVLFWIPRSQHSGYQHSELLLPYFLSIMLHAIRENSVTKRQLKACEQ